jgi:hypothetical protein
MIDVEIHGTGGRTVQVRRTLLEQVHEAMADAPYLDQVTLVDAESNVLTMRLSMQTAPFARVYAPPDILPGIIEDVRVRLAHLFATLEGVQIVRINTRE